MTIQEALDYLNQYRNAGNHIHREAMDMAIEALEHVAEEQMAIKEFENVNPFGEWESDNND